MKPSDVEAEVAKRLNRPKEQIRIVMLDFFNHLITLLQHPERFFYKGVLIEECFKIKLNPAATARSYFSYLKKNLQNPKQKHLNLELIHNNLLKYDQYTEKQKKWIEDSERNINATKENKSTLCGEEPEPEI